MSRPWLAAFSKKKLALSPELRERQFSEAETRRRETFEESVFEQQRQFLKEDQAQWEGEIVRVAEFEELMAILGDSFLRNQKSREVALQNWNAEKEDSYERSEASRDTRFKFAEDRRESLFQKDHDGRLERSEWYGDVRLQHIQRGHHARDKACQQLEQEMTDQFETTSCFLNDAVAAVRRQHDPPVEISVNQTVTSGDIITSPASDNCPGEGNVDGQNGVVSVVHPEDVLFLDQHHAPSGVNGHSPLDYVSILPVSGRSGDSKRPVSSLELYPSHPPSIHIGRNYTPDSEERGRGRRSYSRSCSWDSNTLMRNRRSRRSPSQSRSLSRSPPLREYPFTAPPTVLPQHVNLKPTRSRSPSPVFPVAGNGIDSSQKMTQLPQDSEGPETSLVTSLDSFSARFLRDHHLQEYHFSTQEERRTRCFESAEASRDRAEALRADAFDVAERRRTQQFEAIMRACETSLRQRERSRHWKEAMRSQRFTTSQAHHSRIFEDHLMWIRKRDSAMHDAEDVWILAAKQRLETLGTLHNTVLEQYRLALTRAQPHQRPPSPPPDSISESLSWIRPFIPLARRTSEWQRDRFLSRSRRSRSRSSSRLVRATMPHPAGFALQTLTTKDLGGAYLPLPDSVSHNYNRKQSSDKAENDWNSAQRKRQFLFEESQTERSRIFEHGMRHRRSLFEISENRRQHEFKEAQRARKASSTEAEHDREMKFGRVQSRFEEVFRQGEEQRERAFQNAEKEREHTFQLQQSKRKEAFYLSQEELQTQSFDQENNRASEFNVWWKERMAATKTMVLREKMISLLGERKDDQKIVAINQVKEKSQPPMKLAEDLFHDASI